MVDEYDEGGGYFTPAPPRPEDMPQNLGGNFVPSTLRDVPVGEKDYEGNLQAYQDASNAFRYASSVWNALREQGYFDSDGEVYQYIEKGGGTSGLEGLTGGGGSDDVSKKLAPAYVQRAYREYIQARDDAKKYQDQFEKLTPPKGATGPLKAARTYLDTESDKTSEVRRQFEDFVDRVKSLYSLQDSERKWAFDADAANTRNQQAMQEGAMAWGGNPIYGHERPGGRLSSILQPGIPKKVAADYRLNEAVGLPGGEGFVDPNEYDRMYMSGYAAGTGLGDNGVDPDIAWLIGMPDFPNSNASRPHPGAIPTGYKWPQQGQASPVVMQNG